MYLMLNEETVDFREEKGSTVKRIIRGTMTANDPPILRQIRRDFRPLFVRTPPMLLSRWRFMRLVDEFQAFTG